MSITSRFAWISRGASLGDLLAEVEDHDLVGDVHHEGHVVLHDEDGDAPAPDQAMSSAEAAGLADVEARGRLVEQEELRLGGDGPRELDRALDAEGQAPVSLSR